MSTPSETSKDYRKELSCNRQKWFRDKKNDNTTQFTIIDFEELECLLTTEIPTVVIEPLTLDTNLDLINIHPNPRPHSIHIKTLRHDMGRMDQACRHCEAKFWMLEKEQNSGLAAPKFPVCCASGKVKLPPLIQLPPHLLNLYISNTHLANKFQKNIRAYNSVLACISFGAKVNQQFVGQSVSNFRIHGQVYHLIRLLLPEKSNSLAFAQLYIYDTVHEIENCHNTMNQLNELSEDILQTLQNVLDESNSYIQKFCQVRDIIQENLTTSISMIIYSDKSRDIYRYNAPTSSEVAAIIVSDSYEINPTSRDILLRLHEGNLQIFEFHSLYNPLHYILLFSKGDDVQRLAVHLLGHQHVFFQEREDLQDIINHANNQMTTLTAWFQENINNPEVYELIYVEFPTYYTWTAK
ncbi:26824_t:CDS:2, partial [Dentiscutata erythropus]